MQSQYSPSPTDIHISAKDGKTDFEFNEYAKVSFIPFIAELCAMAGVTDNDKKEIRTLAEFIMAQFSEVDCRAAFTFVEKLNTRLSVSSDRVLVRVLPLCGAPQRVVPAALCPRSLYLCHYSLSGGHPGERWMHDSMRKEAVLVQYVG